MYLSLNWLKDYIDLPKKITPEELGSRLTMHTVEIDATEKQAEKYANIVVGKILEVRPHPNAERLQLARVSIGAEELEIVCGAPNIAAGQMVPVALIGAVLPNGIEIKRAEIRGVESAGMLCAADEIGLGDDHSGILILEKSAKPGQSFAEYLKADDVLFEVDNKSITNRPDLWGHIGMARDICAFLGIEPKKKFFEILDGKAEELPTSEDNIKLAVKVENFELCPRYMALAMENITVAPSPDWLRKRLIAVGVKPINNIVDATNYVMFELGQPLHAFDFADVANKDGKTAEIAVRTAREGELITTLDGIERKLDKDMLVIAMKGEAKAVAGVMGGAESGIGSATKTIVIESANFNFVSIRKTSTRLGLRTEASQRYEKALDPNLCESALARVANLIIELCPEARIASRVVDEKKYSLNFGPIDLDLDWLARFIGQDLGAEKIADIFARLGFGIEYADEQKRHMKVSIPSWRATKDISIREDLAEEIARIVGYDNLPARMPELAMRAPEKNAMRALERKLKDILSSCAAFETSLYSFVGEDQLKKLGIDYSNYIRLANPIASQHTLLRQTLAPNLLQAALSNQARQDEFVLFEIGSIYINIPGGPDKAADGKEKLPFQEKRLGLVMASADLNRAYSWIKSLVVHLCAHFRLEAEFSAMANMPNWVEAGMAAEISADGAVLGSVYPLNKQAKSKLGLKKNAVVAEIGLNKFFELVSKQEAFKFREFEKFPRLVRDLAFVIDEKILYSDIRKEILSFHEFIKEAELFDIYQGDKIGKNNKSLAFHIAYQADKTLTGADADAIQSGLVKRLEERFAAKMRDY